MQCVILAAGEGSRMRPLTTSRPKVMLPLAGKPMLEHLIRNVRDAGITEIILVVGYREEAIRTWFDDGSNFGVSIHYVVQRKQMGTADALKTVEPFIHDIFLMLNGDMILERADLEKITALPSPVMATSTTMHPESFGVVTVENDKITTLEEKSLHPKSNIINAGAYLFDPDIFVILKKLSPSTRGEYELTDALTDYISEGKLTAYPLSIWMDVGYPWDMLSANEHLLETVVGEQNGTVEENVMIKGQLILGKGSVIKSGTYIEGPCIIGENTVVGPNAYLRSGTTIGNNCHIGHAVEIKNSIIFDDTKIPHYNYIGDSVIGSRCNFGAGTKIANLRHDHGPVKVGGMSTGRKKFGAVIGDDVMFGINCSINTGSSIGSGTRVAPHTLVSGMIENKTVVK
ncbi:MAG: sugar phosphate nucleotidyltransferase [Methanocorpusculum sp.]|uniref:bifunctional sugar-1-phosphate nucleotidylyltransferase/acetyltransferase n=1 Tax=Methanocorpusculum sp. TaxID=2058474 RepID=UPI002725B0DC|nr:bifunctional sugar-1-phosphate nucleotidylyltransferase/acetyltransferase [Methanocorpusculum sp.]MDO9523665.1 sugar phosphate nucleotidyltransferase [Methanocorpusculum sp.]